MAKKKKRCWKWIGKRLTPLHNGPVYKPDLIRCRGCPYPRHGLTCISKDGTCLRTDMEAIYGSNPSCIV